MPVGTMGQKKLCRWPFSGPKNGEGNIKMDFHEIGVRADCLCGLVVRVSGYRSRGLGFFSWPYQIF
jgi:hypothetical protein